MRLVSLLLSCLFISSPALAATKIQEIKSDSGQVAWLIEDHTLPVVTTRIEFEQSGAVYDPQGKTGLAYFAAHMLDEGAGDMDSLAFNHALEDHALRFNASASDDSLSISMQAISEYKKKGFELLALAINKPRFDGDAVERMRSGIITDIKQAEEDPSYLAARQWKALAFPNHPYHNPKIGLQDTVGTIKHEDLQQFHNAHMLCSRKLVSFAGDITSEQVKTVLAELFPAQQCRLPEALVKDIKPADGVGSYIIHKQVAQTVIHASVPAVQRNDPRYYAQVILNNILGGNAMISRLGHEIRDKRGLAYYADSDIGEFEHTAYLTMGFATRNAQAKAAVEVFQQELQKLHDNGVTQSELLNAQSYLSGSFPLGLDSQNSLAEYMIAVQHYNLGIDYLEKRNNLINAVTLKQVNDLAKQLFSHKPLIVMVGLPDEGVIK